MRQITHDATLEGFMEIGWGHLLLAGLGMALMIEGLLYFTSPAALKRMLSFLPEVSDSNLRIFGLIAMIVGTILLLLVKNV